MDLNFNFYLLHPFRLPKFQVSGIVIAYALGSKLALVFQQSPYFSGQEFYSGMCPGGFTVAYQHCSAFYLMFLIFLLTFLVILKRMLVILKRMLVWVTKLSISRNNFCCDMLLVLTQFFWNFIYECCSPSKKTYISFSQLLIGCSTLIT